MDPKSVLLGLREKSVGLSKAQTRIPWREIIMYEAISPMPLQDPRPMDPDEDITLQWISLDEAQDMLDHGAIMDAKTIIALQHALLRR